MKDYINILEESLQRLEVTRQNIVKHASTCGGKDKERLVEQYGRLIYIQSVVTSIVVQGKLTMSTLKTLDPILLLKPDSYKIGGIVE